MQVLKTTFFAITLSTINAFSSLSRADIAKGADVSFLYQLVHPCNLPGAPNYPHNDLPSVSFQFYDTSHQQLDSDQIKNCLLILKERDMDTIRLRMFVNPSPPQANADGFCCTNDMVYLAAVAKSLGFRIMIDFHYSDSFADPGCQSIPTDWAQDEVNAEKQVVASLAGRGLTNAEVTAQAQAAMLVSLQKDLSDYTVSVLTELKNAGVQPEWVQVGNEITNGMDYGSPRLWISSISTSSGPSSGGTPVTITGVGFTTPRFPNTATKVYFGDKAATVNYDSTFTSSHITVISPPGVPGSCDITVVTPLQMATTVTPTTVQGGNINLGTTTATTSTTSIKTSTDQFTYLSAGETAPGQPLIIPLALCPGSNWPNLSKALNSGYDAVKSVFPNTKVILHVDRAHRASIAKYFFDNCAKYKVNYDVMGLSDYDGDVPHDTSNMVYLATHYDTPTSKKEVMICEIGHRCTDVSGASTELAKTLDAVRSLPKGRGIGLVYWEPEAESDSICPNGNSAWLNHQPTVAMDAFRGSGSQKTTTPSPSKTDKP